MKQLRERKRPHAAPGFTLVIVMSLLVLLTMLAVGMLSLSTLELRKSQQSQHRQRAQANARLAMMLAIGSLQKNLGPDQRISAPASMATGDATNAKPSHWTGVWDAVDESGKSWVQRDAEGKGLIDKRNKSFSQTNLRSILISGNETENQYNTNSILDDEKSILLVGKNSLGVNTADSDEVRAPRVMIQDESERDAGAYAWWIDDLASHANIATPDGSKNTSAGSFDALLLAQDVSVSATGQDETKNADRKKFTSDQSTELLWGKSSSTTFHDFTVWSRGLLTDVSRGVWKRDLSAFIESNGEVKAYQAGAVSLPGLKDADNIIGLHADPVKRIDAVSPNAGMLRHWANRSRTSAMKGFTGKSEDPIVSKIASGSRNGRPIEFRNRSQTQILPTLVEGSLYYNLSYYEPANPVKTNPYALRLHLYPRVALWNPYNFPLVVPASGIYLHINGNKVIEATLQNGQKQSYRMYWGLTGGSQRGSMFFRMEGITIPAGETLVWSPAANRVYDETNYGQNLLSPRFAPSTARAFYLDKRADNTPLFQVMQSFPPKPGLMNNLLPDIPTEWREMVPPKPAGNIQTGGFTQSDDYVMIWKPNAPASMNLASFNNMPMGRLVSCAFQYGDEDELPVEWSSRNPVPFPKSTLAQPIVNVPPDRRTRDGFRMRWQIETESNVIGGGSLAGTPHLQCSPIATWNMRGAYSYRTCKDNVTDVAPHFFGIYTRDLFDADVDWASMQPRSRSGNYTSDPFDQALRAPTARILFDVPRASAEIASLAAFQHVPFSEFIWHPTYAFGNSLADPRFDPTGTQPDRSENINREKGGWNRDSIGWSTDGRSNNDNGATSDEDNWAWHARSFLSQEALDQNLIYDLSYELNHALWDSFFLSSGTPQRKAALLENTDATLPNGRMRINPDAATPAAADLTNYHRAASVFSVDGSFNVNSLSVPAWEALLLSTVGEQFGADLTTFPRMLQLPGNTWDGSDALAESVWSGTRALTRDEIHRLAVEITREVAARGPFVSLADFVNRRLVKGETGKKGALQAAIDRVGINEALVAEFPLDNVSELPDYRHMDNIKDATSLEQTLKPNSVAWGASAFLTQADVLQLIGPALSARSDTFRIRVCGESIDPTSGRVQQRAWCEAIVQRTPQFIDPSDDTMQAVDQLNPLNKAFGRNFTIIHFRWLTKEEI